MLRTRVKSKWIVFFAGLAAGFLLHHSSYSQTFQNNNTSCEENIVVGAFEINGPWVNTINPHVPHQIVCDQYNDDTDLGAENFPDCVILKSAIPFAFDGQGNIEAESLSLLQNSGVHGNNCLNAGGESQFLEAANYSNLSFTGDSNYTIFTGSLVTGEIDNNPDGFSDIAWVVVNGSYSDVTDVTPTVQSLNSLNTGGFPGPDFNPQNTFFEKPDYEHTPFYSFFTGPFYYDFGDNNKNQLGTDKTMVLADCNEDGFKDAILLAREDEDVDPGEDDDVNIMVSLNNNGLFEPVKTNNSLTVVEDQILSDGMGNNSLGADLVEGDFNQDGHIDLIAVTHEMSVGDQFSTNESAILCTGDGSCNFNCKTDDDSNIRSIENFCNGCVSGVHSMISGDFDGNGFPDIVMSDARNGRVNYLFNQGNAIQDWDFHFVSPQGLPFQGSVVPSYLTKGRFTTTAIQNEIDEVAIPFLDVNIVEYPAYEPGLIQFQPKLLIYPTDGAGGTLPFEAMFFNLAKLTNAIGIASADFDRCGGDDIIALAWQDEGQGIIISSRTSLFLNENESPAIEAVVSKTNAMVNEAITITGSCNDPTFDDRFVKLQVTQAPTGAQGSFDIPTGTLQGKDNTDFAVEFSGDSAGNYTIEVTCEDFCGALVSQTFNITLNKEPTPEPEPEPTPEPLVVVSQGGCLSSLHHHHATNYSWGSLLMLTALSAATLLRKRSPIK